MYNLQRKDALADWERQTAYDSPAQQMARFKQAGLNPNLVYGNQSNSPVIRSTPMDVPNIRPIPSPDFGGALSQFYQIKQQTAQTDATNEAIEMMKLKEQMQALLIAGQVTKNAAGQFSLDQNRRNADLLNSTLTANLEMLKAKTEGQGLSNEYKTATMKDSIKLVAAKVSQTEASTAQAIQHVIESKQLLPYRKREAEARIGNILASTEGKKLQNQFNKLTMATRMTATEYMMEYLNASKNSTEATTAKTKLQNLLLGNDVDMMGVRNTLETVEGIKDIINPFKGLASPQAPKTSKGQSYVPIKTKPWQYDK